MRRFLSLVLSALIFFQIGYVECNAASHYRTDTTNFNMGAQPQGQSIFMQSSPYIPQQQAPYIPQQQAPHVINITPQEPTPQNITIMPAPITVHSNPEINVKKVDATSTGDKISGWMRTVFYLLMACIAGVTISVVWPIIKPIWGMVKLASGGVSWLSGKVTTLADTFAKWGGNLLSVLGLSA